MVVSAVVLAYLPTYYQLHTVYTHVAKVALLPVEDQAAPKSFSGMTPHRDRQECQLFEFGTDGQTCPPCPACLPT